MIDNMTDDELREYTRVRYDQIEQLKAEIKAANEIMWERAKQAQLQRKVESLSDDVREAVIKAANAGGNGKAISPGGNG